MKLRTGARVSTINKQIHELEEVTGNCYFCHKEVNGNFYCFGCHKFVCNDCDETRVFGLHNVKDHRGEE